MYPVLIKFFDTKDLKNKGNYYLESFIYKFCKYSHQISAYYLNIFFLNIFQGYTQPFGLLSETVWH